MHPTRVLAAATILMIAAPTASQAQRLNGHWYGGKAGAITYSFDSIKTRDRKVRSAKKYYFYKKRCFVVGLYHNDARAFRKAVSWINRVITSSAFAKVLHAKKRFNLTRHTSRTILKKLTRRRVVVSVNSFSRNAKYPCPADQANGHTNAFARLNTHFLLIFRPYLRRQSRAGQKGVRELARTVIHETLHTLGYSHKGVKAWSARYMSTVPPFVGCVVQNFPARLRLSTAQTRKLAAFCSLSLKNQRRQRRRYIRW